MEETIIRIIHNTLCDNSITCETLLNRENGFDSMEFVSIILDIEDFIGISLDSHLKEIRECNTVGELIKFINSIQN